jgi:hypothetical protein
MGQICTFGVNWYLNSQTLLDEERQKRPNAMTKIYEIVSIKRAEPPPGAESSNWYRYVIAFAGTNTIHGCRQGCLKAVTSAVEEMIVQLNERHSKKRGREKKT